MFRMLLRVGIIVFVGVCIDVGILFWQAREGRRLPWKLKITPTFDIGGHFE